jgi:hypothetical protein
MVDSWPAHLPGGGQSDLNWSESYEGGSVESERQIFASLARDILDIQLANKRRARASNVERTFHAKSILAVTNAKLHVLSEIPEHLQLGCFRPDAQYRTTVRLSTAGGIRRADYKPDKCGAALRVKVSDNEYHDLLMENVPVSHACNALQYVAFAKAMAGSKLLIWPRLVRDVGFFEARRMLCTAAKTGHRVDSLALERYWSCGAICWGEARPVRYQLQPADMPKKARRASRIDPDYLHREIAERLRSSEVRFHLSVQLYVDKEHTPIEDGTVEWAEASSVLIRVATLTIPQQDIDGSEGRATELLVNQMAFNPWNTTKDFRPLGNLNRARKAVYGASSGHRLEYQFREQKALRNVLLSECLTELFKILNTFVPWHRLYWRLGLLNLSILRDELRAKNLIDTEQREAPPSPVAVPPTVPERERTARSIDGTYNDLSDPKMGSLYSTFGRAMRPIYPSPDQLRLKIGRPDLFDWPNPITVSCKLLSRKVFIPARSLNILAAAWIQFQVHDWVNHPRYDLGTDDHDILVPVPGNGSCQNFRNGPDDSVMRIAGNKIAHMAGGDYPVYRNITTPWWDGSEIYGDTACNAASLREGACLRLTPDLYLPTDVNGMNLTGFKESWWLGLSMMHTLFAREHNVLCQALRTEYPNWPPERIYQTARLVISALIAKIHTLEWTPAILATKTIQAGSRTTWHGAPKDWGTQIAIWLLGTNEFNAIPGTLPNHHGIPYSLTEEFASVYRMHPLIPDDYRFVDFDTGKLAGNLTFNEIQGEKTDAVMRRLRLHNVIYSFGIAHPGAITLHNYPRALQQFTRRNPGSTIDEIIDLSVVDIMRDRTRGVPRFNDFRAALHKPRIQHWYELSEDMETVREIREVYGSIDKVDTMVGLLAEPPPEGFAFSDTAFRIFVLMASRRLQSDRFLTVDFRPEIYSPLGLDWIENNGMTSIILRHCPQLAAVLPRTGSAFAPFRPLTTA